MILFPTAFYVDNKPVWYSQAMSKEMIYYDFLFDLYYLSLGTKLFSQINPSMFFGEF